VVAAGRADGDLSHAEDARTLVERAADELGGLDLLVNAASEGFTPKPVDQVTEADWDAALGATAKGSFFVTQAAARALRAPRASS
jgi:NAD(P)-dependent dehydrogenase (short-subunit alcohol dehydrogenase family)